MRQFVLAPVLAAGLLFSVVPAAQASTEPTPAAPTATTETPSDGAKPDVAPTDESQRIVCRREKPLGSSRPVKTCKTAAAWKAEREEAAASMRGGKGGVRPSGGLGATPGPGL